MPTDNNPSILLLQKLGLTPAQAQTYLALLELEAVSVRKVAAQTGINRGTTYEAIKQLQSLGLVGVRHSGKREYYSAESPEKIHDIIRDKRKDLLQASRSAQQLVPTLLANSVRPLGKPTVRYFEDGDVANILRDVLQTCRVLEPAEYCAYSSRPLRRYLYEHFPNFSRRRVEEGIKVRVIAVGPGGDPAELSERKWLPESDGHDLSSYTLIYGNKVAIISIANDFTPYGVVIEDAGAASMQRKLFEQLWRTL